MKILTKKIFSVFTTIIMCFALLNVMPESSGQKIMITEAAGMTIEQVKAKFPHGKYWNHAGGLNNPDGYTSTPCSHHKTTKCNYYGNCGCNSFSNSIQCMGFAYKVGYDIYGSDPRNWTQLNNMNSLKAGDIIRYKSNGHSIFVTAVNGNIITYADCNSDGKCQIMWNKTMSKSDIYGFSYVKSAPYALSSSTPSSHSPEGFIGAYSGGEGTVFIDGAGYDPDNTNESIRVDIYLRDGDGNMHGIGNFTANGERLDANERYGCGIYHGFGGTINTDLSGEFTLLAALIDTGDDDPRWIEAGKVSVTSPPADTTAPDISDVKISDVTKDGYKVTITVSDNSGVQKVAVPTWTDKNGQDDLFSDWANTALATQTGNNTWTYNVKVSDHNNERGVYYTDVYAWDFSGNEAKCSAETQKRTTVKVGMYNFTVNPNGGTMKDASWKNDTTSAVTYDTALIYNESNWYSATSCIPKRAGCTFTGFYTSATGGTKVYGADGKCVNEGKYFKDNKYIYDSALTVYAQWKSDSVSAKFLRNLNENDTESVTETFTYGTSNQKFGYKTDGTARYSPTNPADVGFGAWSRKGYEMLGWSKDRNAKSAEYSTYSGVSDDWINKFAPSVNLYAVWKAKQYNVKLVCNDGTDKTETIKVTYDSTYAGLTNPARTGYNFNGWFTSADGGTQIMNTDKVAITADQTLYARWSKDKIMITFDALGGTSQVGTKLVTYDNKYGVLPKAEKTGCTFGGWYLDKECTKSISETDIVKITSNQTVYAKWEVAGDVNADGKFSADDMIMLQEYILGERNFTETEYNTADMNADGSVDSFDMVIMRKVIAER